MSTEIKNQNLTKQAFKDQTIVRKLLLRSQFVIEEGGKKYTKEIKKEEFNGKIHKTNLDECKETPTPTPTPSQELPKTGASDAIMSALGQGELTTATLASIARPPQF